MSLDELEEIRRLATHQPPPDWTWGEYFRILRAAVIKIVDEDEQLQEKLHKLEAHT